MEAHLSKTVQLAQKAGIELDLIDEDEGQIWYITTEGIKAFEALVRADERKRIEQAWDKLYGWWEDDDEEKNT